MKVSLIGPPGSGKSTQSERLADRFGIRHIYAGDLLRDEALRNPTVRESLRQGSLVDADIVIPLVAKEIRRSFGYVLDGFPRTMEQVYGLEALHESLDAVIYLELSEPEIVKRLLRRHRPDDTPEIIRRRIDLFHSESDPVIRYYAARGLLHPVDASGDVDTVTRRIYGVLSAVLDPLGRG
ncbi:MAG: adenylate kinase family protein [Armatimonadota bacterium]